MKSLNNAEVKDQPFSPEAVILTLYNLVATTPALAASFLKVYKYPFTAAYWPSLAEAGMGFSLSHFYCRAQAVGCRGLVACGMWNLP